MIKPEQQKNKYQTLINLYNNIPSKDLVEHPGHPLNFHEYNAINAFKKFCVEVNQKDYSLQGDLVNILNNIQEKEKNQFCTIFNRAIEAGQIQPKQEAKLKTPNLDKINNIEKQWNNRFGAVLALLSSISISAWMHPSFATLTFGLISSTLGITITPPIALGIISAFALRRYMAIPVISAITASRSEHEKFNVIQTKEQLEPFKEAAEIYNGGNVISKNYDVNDPTNPCSLENLKKTGILSSDAFARLSPHENSEKIMIIDPQKALKCWVQVKDNKYILNFGALDPKNYSLNELAGYINANEKPLDIRSDLPLYKELAMIDFTYKTDLCNDYLKILHLLKNNKVEGKDSLPSLLQKYYNDKNDASNLSDELTKFYNNNKNEYDAILARLESADKKLNGTWGRFFSGNPGIVFRELSTILGQTFGWLLPENHFAAAKLTAYFADQYGKDKIIAQGFCNGGAIAQAAALMNSDETGTIEAYILNPNKLCIAMNGLLASNNKLQYAHTIKSLTIKGDWVSYYNTLFHGSSIWLSGALINIFKFIGLQTGISFGQKYLLKANIEEITSNLKPKPHTPEFIHNKYRTIIDASVENFETTVDTSINPKDNEQKIGNATSLKNKPHYYEYSRLFPNITRVLKALHTLILTYRNFSMLAASLFIAATFAAMETIKANFIYQIIVIAIALSIIAYSIQIFRELDKEYY